VLGGAILKKVWTFKITGGSVFLLDMSEGGHPDLYHNGRLTLWKFLGDKKDAEKIKSSVEDLECEVELHTEEQSPEQEAERRRRMGLE